MAGNDHGENSRIPLGLLITCTIISFALFTIGLIQLLETNMRKDRLLRNRVLVTLHTFVFFLLNIFLDLDLTNTTKSWFRLIVHTAMIAWICLGVAVAYPFLIGALKAAYKTHASRKGNVHATTPAWVNKLWFGTIALYQLISLILYIFAFSSGLLWPVKTIFVASYIVAIIGALVGGICLIDVMCQLFPHSGIRGVVTGNLRSSGGADKSTRRGGIMSRDFSRTFKSRTKKSQRDGVEAASPNNQNQSGKSPQTQTNDGLPANQPSNSNQNGSGRGSTLNTPIDTANDVDLDIPIAETDAQRKLRIGQLVLRFMVVVTIVVLVFCTYNVVIFILFSNFGAGRLTRSDILDNSLDYSTTQLVWIFVSIGFLFWIYTPDIRFNIIGFALKTINPAKYDLPSPVLPNDSPQEKNRSNPPRTEKVETVLSVLLTRCCPNRFNLMANRNNRLNTDSSIPQKKKSSKRRNLEIKMVQGANLSGAKRKSAELYKQKSNDTQRHVRDHRVTDFDERRMQDDEKMVDQGDASDIEANNIAKRRKKKRGKKKRKRNKKKKGGNEMMDLDRISPDDDNGRNIGNHLGANNGSDENGQSSSSELPIKVIIYEFDGVLTCDPARVFQHWLIGHLAGLTEGQLISFFGDRARVIDLQSHFKKLCEYGVILFLYSHDTSDKLNNILGRIDLLKYFKESLTNLKDIRDRKGVTDEQRRGGMTDKKMDDGNEDEDEYRVRERKKWIESIEKDRIIGESHPVWDSKEHAFILKVIKHLKFNFDEILFVGCNNSVIRYLDETRVCKFYLGTGKGISYQDSGLYVIEEACIETESGGGGGGGGIPRTMTNEMNGVGGGGGSSVGGGGGGTGMGMDGGGISKKKKRHSSRRRSTRSRKSSRRSTQTASGGIGAGKRADDGDRRSDNEMN